MKNTLIILLLSLMFSGCEKVIVLKYKGNQSRIVIEGTITNKPGPYFIRISTSVSLTDTSNYPTIDNAIVTISDNAGNNETLVSLGNGVYSTIAITGEVGRTYTVTVSADGQTYSAVSTMPQPVAFDSIKVSKVVVLGETEFGLVPKYTDPDSTGNNYQFILFVNEKFYKHHLMLNDELQNGVENTQRLGLDDNDLKLKAGDRVEVELQCIDKQVALYYTTLILMVDSGPGGATTPNNPPGNFSNGALGLFSAHTTETRIADVQ